MGSPRDEHGTWCQAYHLCCHTAHEHMGQSRSSMRAHHDQVYAFVACRIKHGLKGAWPVRGDGGKRGKVSGRSPPVGQPGGGWWPGV